MNVRKRAEDHPLVVYMGLVVAAVTATLGIVLPLAQTAHDTEVQNLRLEAQQQVDQVRREGQDQLAGFRDQIRDLDGQIDTLTRQIIDLTAQRSQLEQSLSLAETAHNSEVQKVRLEAQQEIEQARQAGQDQLAALRDQVRALNGQIDGLNGQIGMLAGQVNDLTAQRSQLEQSLSGVQRTLGSESDQIDISHLVVTRDEAKSLPDASLFFPADGFYALNAASTSGWTYELTSELHLLADQGGITDEEEERLITAGGGKVENVKLWPVHLWRRPGLVSIEGFPNVRVMHTQVFLQRAPIDAFLKLQGLDDAAVAAHRDDALLLLLTTELIVEMQQGGQFLSGLETIQQRGSTIYARFESVLRDVTVDGATLPEFYWTRELMVVKTADSFYLVKTFLPNRDHRSPDFAHLTEWFQAFAVLIDG